jgi:rod shape-determining protein MreC
VLVLLALTLIVLDRRGDDSGPLGALRRGSDAVFGPAQRVLGGAYNDVADAITPDGGSDEDLQRRADELQRRVVELESQLDLGRQAQALLGLKDAGSYTTVLARVVAYGGFQPFTATVTIDAGHKDGVRTGMTVASGAGLVGKVVRVGPDTSTVSLLADPVFSAGVRLNGAAGSFGFAGGDGDGRLTLRLVQLPGGRQLVKGDALVTSGEGTIVAGLPVGRITEIGRAVGGQARTAEVEPFADLGALDLVQVIVDGPRTTPRVPIPPAPR